MSQQYLWSSSDHEPVETEVFVYEEDDLIYESSSQQPSPRPAARSNVVTAAPPLDRANNLSNSSGSSTTSAGSLYIDPLDAIERITSTRHSEAHIWYNYPAGSLASNGVQLERPDGQWNQSVGLVDSRELSSSTHQESFVEPSRYLRTHPSVANSGHGEHLGENAVASYLCLAPGCKTRPFRRSADLNRHYKHRHTTTPIEYFPCDYKKCPRSAEPFTRLDHSRSHYREYHNEDLPRRGSNREKPLSKESTVNQKWWRCAKCLTRVVINEHGWLCPSCNKMCDPERRVQRGYDPNYLGR